MRIRPCDLTSMRSEVATPIDAAPLADLVNAAYRGSGGRRGWTQEAELIAGPREPDSACGRTTCHPTLVTQLAQTPHANGCMGCHATGFFFTSYETAVCAG